MDSSPLVSVVVVNFNGQTLLGECLESIIQSKYVPIELIVVDNASTDNSLATAENKLPSVRIIRNQKNLGYAAGANIGIEQSRGEYVLLANNDIILDPDCIGNLVEAANRFPRAASFQPKILLAGHDDVLNTAGNMIHVAGFGICRGLGERDGPRFNYETSIGFPSGACAFISMRAIQHVGLLDATFFAYNEDTDWGWRSRLMGYECYYIPSAKLWHRQGSSWGMGLSPQKLYLLERNRVLSVLKNYSVITLLRILPLLLFVEVAVLLFSFKINLLGSKIRSYTDVLRLRHHIIQARSAVQRRRKVSDKELMTHFVTELRHPYVSQSEAFNRIFCVLCRFLRVPRHVESEVADGQVYGP